MAILFRTDGTKEIVYPKKGKIFSLEELQDYVDGDIECVTTRSGRIFVMNEEGKLRGLLVNMKATTRYHLLSDTFDVLVGDVLLCSPNEIE